MDKNILNTVRKKRSAFKRYSITRSEHHYQEYKRLRNIANMACRKGERNFEVKLVQDIKRNPQPFYRYVKNKTAASKPKLF